MGSSIAPGNYKIVSLVEGNPPTSVNLTLPGFQRVYLNGPVTNWVVKREGENAYRLSVGGYPYTGVVGDEVTASIHSEQNLEWLATYQVFQSAYTISPVNDSRKGWTVAEPSNPDSGIKLALIVVRFSEPPQFLPTQLFRFVPV